MIVPSSLALMGDFHENCFLYREPDCHLKEAEVFLSQNCCLFMEIPLFFLSLDQSIGERGKKHPSIPN